MYFSDSVTLRKVSYSLDSYGSSIPSYVDTTVFADKQSVKRSEFYASKTAGIKIDIVFSVHAEDFYDQSILIHNSTSYDIIRVYKKGEGIVELNCAVREVLNTVTFTVTSGGSALASASIVFNNETKTTNSSGVAVFYGVQVGTLSYTVSKTGYTTKTADAVVTGDLAVAVGLAVS